MTVNWHYQVTGHPVGPVTAAKMRELLRKGEIHGETPVWSEGMSDWTVLGATEFAEELHHGRDVKRYEMARRHLISNYKLFAALGTSAMILFVPLFYLVADLVLEYQSGGVHALTIVLGSIALLVELGMLVPAIVMGMIQVFRLWRVVPPGCGRVGAGVGVGFLTIPVFNWYWGFVGFFGLAQDLNATADRENTGLMRTGEKRSLVAVIGHPIAVILFAGSWLLPVNWFFPFFLVGAVAFMLEGLLLILVIRHLTATGVEILNRRIELNQPVKNAVPVPDNAQG